MDAQAELTRRTFLQLATTLAGGLAIAACAPLPAIAQSRPERATVKADVTEVLPVEDLMREHGVLRRILLVYGEAIRRLEGNESLDPAVVSRAATLVRRFVEDYHEKSEEDHVFPHFRAAGKLVDLVQVLKDQHEAGRRVTARILERATVASLSGAEERAALAADLRRFIRMYEPHAAREDTVLFPAFRSVVTPAEYDRLSDVFEDQEHRLFGANGFEDIVGQVSELERALGIHDLSRFTPA